LRDGLCGGNSRSPNDTPTTVGVPVTIIARRLAVGQCCHGGGAERALHSRDDIRAVIFQCQVS